MFGFLGHGTANASRSSEMCVTVMYQQGLGDISAQGLGVKTAKRFKQRLWAAKAVLGENLTSVRSSQGHHGFD